MELKIAILIIVAGVSNIFAATTYSQTAKVSLDMENRSLEQVMDEIERQSEFYFIFNQKQIDVNREIDIQVNDELISNVLGELFAGTDINYTVLDRKILLTTDKIDDKILKASAEDQEKRITGKVTDKSGSPLGGVTVLAKGTSVGVITDFDGKYSLSLPSEASVLTFSFVGMTTKDIPVGSLSVIDVVLEESAIGLEEVIVVGYGTQKKVATTSSLAVVKGDDLIGAPVANVSNSITGRLPGVLSFQSSGEPGSDATTLRIRGVGTTGNANALVIIDGIPRSLSDIDPNEVETITVLKDAAAVAPYGLGGANGVILITTKRGQEGKLAMNYKAYYGTQQPTFMPDFLDAYGYASALNTANDNIGGPHPFTEDALQKLKDGSDPDHYPNTDWVHEIVNFKAPITQHNLSFSGGSQKVRFYSNLGYLYQEGVVSEINFKRYNVLLNVDADVTNTTTLSLDLNGSQSISHDPAGASGTGIFTDVTEIPPTLPLQFSNGMPAHAMLPNIYKSGYSNELDNALNAKIQLEQKISFIDGLKVKGVFNYNISPDFSKTWTLPRAFYKLDASDLMQEQPAGPPSPTLSQSFGMSQSRMVQAFVTYDRTFGNHNLSLLGVYEGRQTSNNSMSASRVNYELLLDELSYGSSDKNNFNNGGSSSRSAQMGWVYRMNYSFSSKYFVEFSGRYDGHYYFAPDKRFAFFPSASLGWRISEENFMKGKMPWLDNLKLRASYGKSGNLAGNAFQYLTSYLTRPSYIFGGTSPVQVLGAYESSQANKNITWETANKTNLGFDALILKGKLDISMDVYHEKRSDMLLSPATTVPAEYGIGLSQVNAGIMENHGFDLNIGTKQDIFNDFQVNAEFNLTYAKNKLVETYETAATFNNPNRRQTGRPMNTRFGLESLGLFQTSDFDEDGTLRDDLPVPSYGPVKAGDIRYADLAGIDADGNITGPDGVINVNDYTVIGNPSFPQMIFGMNIGANYKGFDLTMLWQGAGAVSMYLESEMASPFFNGAKIYKEQLDYWTPDNTNASFPRLTPTPTTNNQQVSSFWVKDGTYLRLKTLELGYTIPKTIVGRAGIKSLRVYFSGSNMLTFSKLKYLDPELASSRARYYFQQKVLAFGINLGF
ncbi:MAG TPA: TonB-dependent receptor [Bacteroidales bacterium]|nr:TonB-dependent receptor [Bacteroidales bacterium]